MHTDFFTTVAQVLPILFLAFVFEGRGKRTQRINVFGDSTAGQMLQGASAAALAELAVFSVGIGEARCLASIYAPGAGPRARSAPSPALTD